MGASPAGGVGSAGGVPLVPGVSPVDAGRVGVAGAAVGSWEAVAELTAVTMDSAAAAGTLGSPMDGILGRTGGLTFWWVSVA